MNGKLEDIKMEFTKEMMEKAKAAKSAEELIELAKAEGVELTAEGAEKAFAELNRHGELADEELDNVAAGGICDKKFSPGGAQEYEGNVVHLYKVGQEVEVIDGFSTRDAVILELCTYVKRGYYCPSYKVRYKDNGKEAEVSQVSIAQP